MGLGVAGPCRVMFENKMSARLASRQGVGFGRTQCKVVRVRPWEMLAGAARKPAAEEEGADVDEGRKGTALDLAGLPQDATSAEVRRHSSAGAPRLTRVARQAVSPRV